MAKSKTTKMRNRSTTAPKDLNKNPSQDPSKQNLSQDLSRQTPSQNLNQDPNQTNPSLNPAESAGFTGTFNIGRFFVKKINFDGSPAMEMENSLPTNVNPDIKIELFLNNIPLKDDSYEVDLSIKATATINNKPFFSGSIQQAGIFTAKNFSTKQLDFILKGYCPALLFPYARESISNIMTRGGFKTIELPAIDFVAVYQKGLQDQAEKKP